MRINMWGSVCTLSIKSSKSLSTADSFDYDQRLKQYYKKAFFCTPAKHIIHAISHISRNQLYFLPCYFPIFIYL